MEASSGGHNIPKIQTFRPTWEEFKDFNKFIEYVESKGAHKAGICKIIPPKEWVPRKSGYDDIDVMIPAPITQVVHGKQGLYTQYNVQRKSISVKNFEKMANSSTYKTPKHADYDDLERRYWKNITFVNPIYGADVNGSITDKDQDAWNISRLGSILDCLGDDYGISIDGVNTAYLYFGMWKTTFAWHTEDMDLYSINYVHYGAPKRWYAIPPEHGRRLERLAQEEAALAACAEHSSVSHRTSTPGFFAESHDQCPAFLRHKMSLISPTILKRYSIPVDTVVQEAGEIIITFPYGYHSGFNHGFNCAESTNFASRRWIEYGKRCLQCHCRKDSVKIDMGAFVKRFQPEIYERWRAGKDLAPHPEDDRIKHYNHNHHASHENGSNRAHNSSSPADPVIIRQGRGTIKRDNSSEQTSNSSLVKRTKLEGSNGEDISSAVACSSSDLDASTDISDALTDVETETNNHTSQAAYEDKSSPSKSAQTHTGTCSSKKKKSNKGSLHLVDLSWSKSLTKLWKFNKPDFDAEIRYNTKMSQRAPYCAVCSMLNQREAGVEPSKVERTRTPRTSIPLLPASSFMSSEDWDLQTPSVKPSKPRALLVCTVCKVCVHDTCYGVKFLPDGPTNWKCSRCSLDQDSAECTLCCLRGGALKPTTSGRWAHIVCAIANTEVSFKSVNQREPIVTSNISKQRITLKCMYCGVHTYMNGKDRYGKCVQCSTGQCAKSFHFTCARAAGLKIDVGSWPFRVHITCNRHMEPSHKVEERKERPPLNTKDEVYAKHKNGRYYKGEVEAVCAQMFYCVLFDDNSTSKDLFPEDILNYQPRDGPPPLGSFVNVKWPDDITYNGNFQGTRQVQLYTVQFEDGSQVQVEREQVYSIHEQLPMNIQKRLSSATEMKNDIFYRKDSELLTEKRTRGVQVNYNYKWEYTPKMFIK